MFCHLEVVDYMQLHFGANLDISNLEYGFLDTFFTKEILQQISGVSFCTRETYF